ARSGRQAGLFSFPSHLRGRGFRQRRRDCACQALVAVGQSLLTFDENADFVYPPVPWFGGSTPMLSMRRVCMVAFGIGFLATLTVFLTAEAEGQGQIKARMALRKGPFIEPQPNPTLLNTKPGEFTDAISYDDRPEYKRYIGAAQDCIRDEDWNKASEALQKILD